MKDNPFEKNINKNCVICGKNLLVDRSGNGECPHCGWYNNITNGSHEDIVMYPNVVSENKARKLVAEGKPLTPNLKDFMDMTDSYRETEFWYKGLSCCIFESNEGVIEFGWDKEHVYYFDSKEDFIKNAKIFNEYIHDIWDKVEDPKYM